jgi:hypothetical protein
VALFFQDKHMLMEVPRDTEVIEMPSSTLWFDQEGVLYSISKPQQRTRTLAEIHQEMDRLRQLIGTRKVCIIMESHSRAQAVPKDQRDAIAEELNSVTKALAIVSSSALSRMVANLFFSFKPPRYPMKLFSNPQDARQWIGQYI